MVAFRATAILFKIATCALIFIFAGDLQLLALNPEQKMNRFTTECFDSSKGLPQNTVADILQDRSGYILFATQEGLVKYDGKKFAVISENGFSNSLSRNITKINESENGSVSYATASGIIDFKEKEKLFEGTFVKDFLSDKGITWVATYSSGVIKVETNGTMTFFSKENGKINSNVVSNLFVDSKGHLFVATLEGLSFFQNDSFVPVEGLYAFSYEIAEDKNGWIWVATERGLALIKEGKLDYIYSPEDGLSEESLRSVFVDRSNAVWIGTEKGRIIRFFNGKFSVLPEKGELKMGAVISIIEDREGNIWFGTEATGACIVRDGTIFQAGINSGNIRSLTETTDGEIWAATFGEGIKILKKDETVSTIGSSDGLRSDSIATVYADKEGRVWIGTRRNGVQIYSNGKIADFDSFADNFSQAHPVSPTLFFEDSRGNIWIADRHSQRPVFVWKNGVVTSYEIGKGDISILDIAENSKGVIYLVSMNEGVFTFDGNSEQFTKVDVKKDVKMTSVFIDKFDRLWITTLSQGIIIKVEKDIVELNETNGLFSNTVHDIVQDNNGSYWFSTNRGIFTITEKDVEKLIKGSADNVNYRLFKEEDGMQAGECNGGSQPSVIKSSDGTIWFPTIRGVVTVDPSKIEQRVELPPVSIVSALIDNSNFIDFSGKNELAVAPGTKNILINFTSLFFSHPAKVRFEYMLDGFDSTWNLASERRNANYTNITPGVYTFSVKAYLADTPENFSVTSVKVTVKPFFYQDTRFRAIAAIILLLLILAAYNIKIRVHKQREKQLKDLVDRRTEELVKVNEKLKQSILKDPMTGLCNRRYLFEIEQPRYESLLLAAQKNRQHSDRRDGLADDGKVAGLFLLDIGGLKKINEKRGYDFGDRLLRSFAETLKKSVRKDDLVVRWGGDEFLVILNSTDFDHLPVYAKKIASIANEGIEIEGEDPVKLSLSIGFSAMPFYSGAGTLNFEESLLMSDMALFKALSQGAGAIKHAVPGTSIPGKEQVESFMKDIDQGIKNNYFNILDI